MRKTVSRIISAVAAVSMTVTGIFAVAPATVANAASTLAQDVATIDSQINSSTSGGDYVPQFSRIVEDRAINGVMGYKKKFGLCNICAMTNLLNRKLALDGKLNSSSKFTREYVSKISCMNLSGNGLSASDAEKLVLQYFDNYPVVSGSSIAYSGSRGLVLPYDTDGYFYSTYSSNGKNYKVVKDNGAQTQAHLAELLEQHHEGIFVRFFYDNGSGGHCIVLKNYVKNGDSYQFYAVDTGSKANGYDGRFEDVYIGTQVRTINSSSIDFVMYLDSVSTAAPFAQSGPIGGTVTPAPTVPKLDLSNVSLEKLSITEGDYDNILGTITSTDTITSVEAKILDSNGNKVQGKVIKPNAKSVNLKTSAINSDLKFGTLKSGSYTLKVFATNKNGTKSKSIGFTVKAKTAEASTLSAGSVYLGSTSFSVGTAVNVTGTIKSNYSITQVTGSIKDANGNVLQTKTIKPNAKSVDVSKTIINSELYFGKLAQGKYTFLITAKDSKKTAKKEIAFSVTAVSTLKVSASMATTTITKGNSCNITGTVSSNYTIKTVKGEILNSSGTVVQTKTVSPNAKTLNLKDSEINSSLKFGSLAVGSYKLKITATDTRITKSQTINFTVKAADPASTLKVSAAMATTTITKGNSCNITGTVSSNYTIKTVKGEILNSAGTAVQTKTVSPNAKTLNLKDSDINAGLKFGSLAVGSYKLKITATDSKTSKSQTISFTVKAADPASTLNVSGVSMATTSITQGSSCNITGTITSNYAITSVKGQILNSSGTAVQTKTITPNSTSVDIKSSAINSDLKFGTLAPGSYTLKIVATDKKTSKTRSISFTVQAKSSISMTLGMSTTSITMGNGCNITGTVTSDAPITSVKGWITTGSTTKQTRTVYPGGSVKTFDIKSSAINQDLKFGTLARGSYVLHVTATNSNGATTTKTINFTIK